MNKVVIVTGAFGGLGKAVASDLTERGYSVAAIDVGTPPVDFPAALTIGNVFLADTKAVRSAFGDVTQALGPVTALVNIADGFPVHVEGFSFLGGFAGAYRVNLNAITSCEVVAALLTGEGGAIVNVGAPESKEHNREGDVYTASCAGILALTKRLANEFRPRGVRVNAILPASIPTAAASTANVPAGTRGRWDYMAKTIAFLLSDDAGAISGVGMPLSFPA